MDTQKTDKDKTPEIVKAPFLQATLSEVGIPARLAEIPRFGLREQVALSVLPAITPFWNDKGKFYADKIVEQSFNIADEFIKHVESCSHQKKSN